MKESTKQFKVQTSEFAKFLTKNKGLMDLFEIQSVGKVALDKLHHRLGRMLAESIMCIDREESAAVAAQDGNQIYSWGYQPGSIFIGPSKVSVTKPRAKQKDGNEVHLQSYEKLKSKDAFSEELLGQLMAGLSGGQYKSTIAKAADAFGVSQSSVSRHFVRASAKKLKGFLERDLSERTPFAILMDTVHRGGIAFIVGLGVDSNGDKQVLGYWEGSTENATITNELLSDLERRGLKLNDEIIFITDGGKGIISALKSRFGDRLIHQRCTIHKDRNIQGHLAKKYRKKAHDWYRMALKNFKYGDAKKELLKLRDWLHSVNPSAARSLDEALEEVLTAHRLQVPEELRRSLATTNAIENVFSVVRHREKNMKNYSSVRKGKSVRKNLSQRWLGTVLLNAESGFRKVKGFAEIPLVIASIRKSRMALDTSTSKAA
jgi:transposase-like protein